MRSPFQFLDSFEAKDKDKFFGRDAEIETLYNLVHETPLVLVYGMSGTGKTSLVQCGLATRFDGPDWLPLPVRRGNDLNESLTAALQTAAEKPIPADEPLPATVEGLFYTYFRPVYLIFDQFEELFILGSDAEQQEFMQSIRALLDAELPARVVFIVREEYIGEFYEFEKTLPTIFDHKLRVESMKRDRVKQVMAQSFAQFNITLPEADDELRQLMIDNISAGKSGIPLTYLQVYLDMLYREDFVRTYPNGAPGEALPPLEFTRAKIEEFGRIDDVLERYLEEQTARIGGLVKKQFPNAPENAVRTVLDAFATEEGTKRPVDFSWNGELVELRGEAEKRIALPTPLLSSILEELQTARILRFADARIELAHDSLAQLIERQRTDAERQLHEVRRRLRSDYATWRGTGEYLSRKRLNAYEEFVPLLGLSPELKRFLAESERDVRRRRQEQVRRQRWYVGILSVLLIISCGVSVWAFNQKKLADKRLQSENNLRKQAESDRILAIKEKSRAEKLSQMKHNEQLIHNTYNYDRTISLRIAEATMRMFPNQPTVTKLFAENLNYNFHYSDIFDDHYGMGNSISFSIDEKNPLNFLRKKILTLIKDPFLKSASLDKYENIDKILLSPDGSYFLVHIKDASKMKLYNWKEQIVAELNIDDLIFQLNDVKFSSDGNFISFKANGTLIVWDWKSSKHFSLGGIDHELSVGNVIFSPTMVWAKIE